MKKIVALIAVAGMAAAAVAAPNSQFKFEVSTDGGATWVSSSSVSVNTAGAAVQVLARTSVRYVRNDGPATILLGSARHQPLVSGVVAGDSVLPFTATTVVAPNFGDGIQASDLGRLYGATTVGAVVAQRPVGGSTIHFAEAAGTDLPGAGNNAAGNRGVNTAANVLSAPDIDTTQWLPLWQFGLVLEAGAMNSSRTVDFSVPQAGLRLNNGNRSLGWTSSRSPLTTQEAAWMQGEDGAVTINVIPAPGAAALVGLAGLVAGRRRR